jgi:hypothetical protein
MTAPQLNAAIQGQGTISADNLNTFVQTAQDAAMLRTFVGLIGMVVNLQGIAFPNDGLGGFFYWNASGTEADDNLDFIVPTGNTTGEWERFGILQPVSSTSFSSYKFNGSVSASGSTQSTATILSSQINVVTTVGVGTGVQLPEIGPNSTAILAGTPIKVFNRGVNILSVYPPPSMQIESLGSNNPAGISVNGVATYIFSGTNQWWAS